jgi:hypothetical protein
MPQNWGQDKNTLGWPIQSYGSALHVGYRYPVGPDGRLLLGWRLKAQQQGGQADKDKGPRDQKARYFTIHYGHGSPSQKYYVISKIYRK